MRFSGIVIAATLLLGSVVLLEAAGCGSTPNKWSTKRYGGTWRFTKDDKPIVLRGVSMTGWETGTRETESGGGYWLFEVTSASEGKTMMQNIVDALYGPWKMNVIRMPICGSAWLQNYAMQQYMGGDKNLGVDYHTWVSQAVCYGASKGMATIIDNHLWAIAKETVTTKNTGVEDGCTGYQVAPPENKTNACSPKDWYGKYTSTRTGKSYNSDDKENVWECPIANADGVTLDALFKSDATYEHFLNLWFDVATYFKGSSGVWFELFNEPYERKSADFGKVDPLGPGLGGNVPEAQYKWEKWSKYNEESIKIIRDITDQIILVSGHDWSYDYLGDYSSETPGPILAEKWITWKDVKNIGYAFHPYQHGTCCGKIGSNSDESKDDPYQSAFCLYPPVSGGKRVASNAALPKGVTGKTCDTIGYADTQNKKGAPCIWKSKAMMYPDTKTGLCAGDRDECSFLDEAGCTAKNARWQDPDTGGWSKYVLPMQFYGPLIATEFGPFDCSSPFSQAFVEWCRMFGVSYTVWALWPQNSGGPGAGACGYPSVIVPNEKGNFGVCKSSCSLEPLPWSAPIIKSDIAAGQDECDTSPCLHGACKGGSCSCKKGWSGSKCDTKDASYTLCSPNPCKNGGACKIVGGTDENADTYFCQCPKEYFGFHCEYPSSMRGEGVTCSADSCNGGTCVIAANQIVCRCANGENTPDCKPSGPSTCSLTCKNGGTLDSAACKCNCKTGTSGDDCGTTNPNTNTTCASSTACKNGGTRSAAPNCKCSCTKDYTGTRCETAIPTCTLKCGSHGSASTDCTVCECTEGWAGDACDQDLNQVDNKCDVAGYCKNGGSCIRSSQSCNCANGYTGTTCTVPPAGSCTLQCKNGGECVKTNAGAMSCSCVDGYTGLTCQTAPAKDNGGSSSGGNTLLIIIIVLLVLIILGGIGFYCYRQQQQQKRFSMRTAGMTNGTTGSTNAGYGYGAQRPGPPTGAPGAPAPAAGGYGYGDRSYRPPPPPAGAPMQTAPARY